MGSNTMAAMSDVTQILSQIESGDPSEDVIVRTFEQTAVSQRDVRAIKDEDMRHARGNIQHRAIASLRQGR
jgi:hypothetical protein